MPTDPSVYVFPAVGLLLAALGVAIARTPASKLLQWDRHTGHWIYRRAPDEQTGLERAARFYKVFGWTFAVLGLGIGGLGFAIAVATS